MVAVLIRLKLTVLRRSLGRETSRLLSYLFGAIFAGLVALGSIPVAIGLRTGSVDSATTSILVLAVLTALWMLAPLLTVGVDGTLDPEQLSLLPLRARQLLPGLVAAALVGLPGVVTVVFALDYLLVWSRSVLAFALALVGAVLAVATAVVLSRAVSSLLARSLWKRRSRFAVMMVLPLLYLAPATVNLFLLSGNEAGSTRDLVQGGRVAAWTPFGWAWAMPWQIARGAYGSALLDLALALVFLAVLVMLWERVLTAELTSTSPLEAAKVRGLQNSPSRRSSALAAITRRRLLGWRRDTRLAAQGVSLTALSLLPIIPSVFGSGRNDFAAFPAAALLTIGAGALLANDLAYDGSAWWMQVVAGVPGWVDRAARVLAIGIPLLVIGVAVSVLQISLGQQIHWLLVAGPTISALLIALALGCALGALDPGQAPRRGSNPFAGNAGNGTRGCLTVAMAALGPVLLSTPVIIGAVLARHSTLGQCAVLVVGTLWGGAALTLSIWWGGQQLDRHAAEMLEKLRVFA